MRSFAVSLEAGLIVEADEVMEHEDGRLIFYIDNECVMEFPAEAVLGYSEIDD